MLGVRKLMLGGAKVRDIVLNAVNSASTGSTASFAATLPSGGYTGCYLIAVVSGQWGGSAAYTASTGWTKILTVDASTTMCVFTRPWVAGASLTVSLGGNATYWGVTVYLVDTPVKLGAVGSRVSGVNPTLPSITANTDATLLIIRGYQTGDNVPSPLEMPNKVIRLPSGSLRLGSTDNKHVHFGYMPLAKGGPTGSVPITRLSGSLSTTAIMFSLDRI